MAFNPFNLFKGNPKVIQLMSKNEPISSLLMEQPFISEFKRSENENLQNYMNYERYEELIKYVTVMNEENPNDKNRSYKFPFVATEILAVNNQMTYKYLLQEVVYTEEEVEEQIEVERQFDSDASDRSYSSIKSNNSNRSRKSSRGMGAFHEADKQNFVLAESGDKSLSDFLDDDKSINEDDFPDVKPKKTRLVKETAWKTVKKPLQPLVFKLLRYFQESKVIHILDGYVSKILDNVLTNKFNAFIQIVSKYNNFNKLKSIFDHIDSNSVQDLLLNFINKLIDTSDVTPVNDYNLMLDLIQDHCLQRVEQWQSGKLTLEDRAYYLNLYSLVIDKIDNKIKDKENAATEEVTVDKELQMLETMANGRHIQSLTSVLAEVISINEKTFEHTRIIMSYLKILKEILQTFLTLRKLKSNERLSRIQSDRIKQMVQNCEDSFDYLINLAFSYVFEDYLIIQGEEAMQFKPQHSLTSKLQFLLIVSTLASENVYFSRKTIIGNPFFEHLLKLLKLHPNSSIFHNTISKIILPFVNLENDLSTINKFFQKKQLLKVIFETVKQDNKQRFQLKQKTRKCYIGQIISICLSIDKFQCEDSQDLVLFKQTEQWQYIHECLIEQENGVRKKVLGGLEKQHGRRPIIFFKKQDCLKHFKYFLSGLKTCNFDEFQNYSPGNSDSEDQNDIRKRFQFDKEEDVVQQTNKVQSDDKYFDQDTDL